MIKLGGIKHILLTGVFLLSLLTTTSLNSFGQCIAGTSGIADLTTSWVDSCGAGGTVSLVLTNNTPNIAGFSTNTKFRIFQNGILIHDTTHNGQPNFLPYSHTVNINGFANDTFQLFILTNNPVDTCDIDTAAISYFDGSVSAGFSMSSSNICANDNVTFTSSASGNGNLSHFWDFASTNGTSTAIGPHNHTYGTASPIGNPFQIIHVVQNACDTDTTIQNLTVNAGTGGAMDFTIPNDTFCISQCLQVTNTSTAAPASYGWTMGDGSGPIINANPGCYNYATPGTYTIQLTDFVGASCNTSFSQTVHIAPVINGLVLSGDDGDGDTRNCLPYNSPITTENVTFTANATGAYYYDWNFGDGTGIFSTPNNNINHTFTSYGTFQVVVTARNGGNCDISDTIEVIFQRNPYGDVVSPVGFFCTPYDYTPVDNNLNGNTYIWNFGDGTEITTNGASPTHTYLPPGGSPPIWVEVANECDTVMSNIVNIILINGPAASFTTDVNEYGCVGEEINFYSTSGGMAPPDNIKWIFGDGNDFENEDTTSHTYNVADTFSIDIIARVLGPAGCPNDTTTVTLIIHDDPTADFSIAPLNGCVPTNATIVNNSTGAELDYEWWVNGTLVSTDTLLDDSVFVPEINTYNIDLVVRNNCEDDTMSITLNYDPTTFAAFTPINDTTICKGQNINFNDISTGINNAFKWDFDEDWVPDATNNAPNHIFNNTGTFVITEVVTGTCGSDTDSVSVTVLDVPVVNFSLNSADICLGDTILVTDNSTPPSATFQWASSPATLLGAADPKDYVFTNPGTNYIALFLDAGGCKDTDSVFVEVRDLPDAIIGLTTNAGCTPATFNFANNSTGSGITYVWDFDNGNTSTLPGLQTEVYINNSFVVDSVKDISLIVTNQYGCLDTALETITIHPTPVADFSMSTNSACANDPINFVNNSQPLTSTFLWDFGDATTSTAVDPIKQYAAFGAYEVILTASNIYACVGKDTDSVFVDQAPIANFTFQDLCLGDSTLFTNTSTGNIDTAIWTYGYANLVDTIDVVNTNTGHVYANAGAYSVNLEVINLIGCRDDITQNLNILAVPTADFNFANVICEQKSTNFSDNSANHDPLINFWDFGDGNNIIDDNPTYSYADTGFYDVLLVATNAVGCTDSITKQIWVDSIPTPQFTAAPVCINDTTLFTNNTFYGADTVHWDFDDGTDTSVFSPKHVYDASGPYDVLLVAGYISSGCVDSITISVNAYERIIPSFTTDTICFKETTAFTNTSTNTNNGPQFSWDFGYNGNPGSALTNPTHNYPDSAGYYIVQLNAENSFGCKDSVSDSVFVKQLPVIGFVSDTVCLGLSTELVDTTEFAISWKWTFPDFTVQTNDTANFVFSNYGNHPIELIVENTYNCFDTLNSTAYVDSIPTPNFTNNTSCIFDTVFFNNLTPAGADTFYWDFGDGNIDSVFNPKHVYDLGGIYNVQLIAGFSGSSCFDSTTIQVTSHQRSNPGFIADTVCFKELTAFTDTTLFANIVDLYEWDFDDNSGINNSVNPTHQFPDSSGTYQVKLTTTTDSGCVDSIIVPITVNPLPEIGFTSDTVCPGLTTTLTDTTQDAQNWIWDFGDNLGASGSQIESHIYPDSGKYYVKLIVFNSFNCRDTLIDSILVHPRPTPGFFSDTACNSYTTTFTDTSIDALNFNWDFQDGIGSTSIFQNPTYTFTNHGIQNVELLVENAEGCKDSITKPVLVHVQPIAGFISSAVCAGNSSVFTDTSTFNPNFWLWDFKDATPIDSNQNPTHTYYVGGNVGIELIVGDTNTGCFDTLNTTTIVNTIPVPDFTADTVCLGSITTFTDLSTDPFLTITNWDWNFGDNNTSPNQNPQYIYQDSGKFTTTLKVTNNGGCDSTFSKDVYVKFTPVAGFDFDTVCAGAMTTFTDTSSGPPTSWNWVFGDSNTDTNGPVTTHSYQNGGQFFATLIVDVNGCSDQVSKVVDVFTGITAQIDVADTACINDLVAFGDSSILYGSTVGSTYWDFGDANGSTSQHPKHTYANPGVYQVILIDTTLQGCVGSDTQNIYVSALPVADFTTANPAACSDQITSFLDQSTTAPGQITDWHWNYGDSNYDSTGTSAPKHQYLQPGNYAVELIVFNESGCSDSVTKLINVFDIPHADFNYQTSCKGDAVPLNDQSSIGTGSIQSWEWTFPDASTDNQINSQYIFDSNVDSAVVQLVVTSNNGCTDTINKYVSFHPDVVFDFRAVNASGCQPYDASFEDNSYIPGNSSSNITNWLWNFGDGEFAFPVNPNHIYEDAGDYEVMLTVTTSDGCEFTDTLGYDIYVHPRPVSDFSYGPDSISVFQPVAEFSDLSQGGNSWVWKFGDGDSIVDVLNPTHEYPTPGEYLVSYTVINNFNCSATTSKLLIVEDGFDYHIPNTFTPNNDGKNDIFLGQGVGVQDMRMFIFGRGGEIIFESYSPNVGWNGKVKDSKAKAKMDTYVYKIIVTDIFGGEHVYRGHVNLLK